MTQSEFGGRKERAESERFVISLNDDGNFRVYSPAYPSRSYTVTGTSDGPICTCPDFESHKENPEWKCKHMLAVMNLVNRTGEPTEIQVGAPQPVREENMAETVNGLQMHIKRSVSPDGKIDSLSLEVSYPVESGSSEEIKESAAHLLGVISEIVEGFKAENGNASEQRNAPQNAGNGTVAAQILGVGSVKGKWGGRRLCLNFDVNGREVKLFGSEKELAQYISIGVRPEY